MKKKSPKRVKPKRANRSKSEEATLRALRRTQLAAQKIARLYGMPIHFWGEGNVAAEKPRKGR